MIIVALVWNVNRFWRLTQNHIEYETYLLVKLYKGSHILKLAHLLEGSAVRSDVNIVWRILSKVFQGPQMVFVWSFPLGKWNILGIIFHSVSKNTFTIKHLTLFATLTSPHHETSSRHHLIKTGTSLYTLAVVRRIDSNTLAEKSPLCDILPHYLWGGLDDATKNGVT